MVSKSSQNNNCPSPLAIWAALIVVYIVWGSTYLAIRFAIESMPPFLMAGVRFIVAGAILFIWRRLAGDPLPTTSQWRSAAVIGLFLLLGGNGGVVWAETRVASGVAALMVGSAPLWMVMLDAIRSRRRAADSRAADSQPAASRPRWATLAGVLLGFAGVTLLISPSEFTGLEGGVDLLGAGVLTLAAFSWAVGSLYSRQADLPDSPLLGTGMEMLAGGAALMVWGTLAGDWARLDLSSVTSRSLLGLIYLIVFGSLFGFGAYTWLLRVAPTTLVSTYAYVNPLVAILLGNLLASEPLSVRVLLAAGIILSGVVLITLTQPARARGRSESRTREAAPGPATAAAPCTGED